MEPNTVFKKKKELLLTFNNMDETNDVSKVLYKVQVQLKLICGVKRIMVMSKKDL